MEKEKSRAEGTASFLKLCFVLYLDALILLVSCASFSQEGVLLSYNANSM